MTRVKGIASLFASGRGRRPVRRRERRSWLTRTERLEPRAMLTVTPTLIAPGVLQITYDSIAGQSCIVEIEQAGSHNIPVVDFTADVNVYAPSNSTANPAAPPATTTNAWFFPNISQIIVLVPNSNLLGVNNNSLTIKGINGPSDRIIIGGAGTTAAGRWSSETAAGWQCLLSVEGIDDLTVTAGGTINVSGSFTNDTQDASIRAIGQVAERAAEQHTATVTIGETTPAVGVQPRPWLFSNTIEIVGAELDIYSSITATDRIDLRAGDSAPDTGRSNLVLPYDITVLGNGTTGEGVLSLFSTKNITQLQTSTILAPSVVAISNVARAATTDGPWMIDLGTATNDFDEISLGMTAAPGDATVDGTQGRIGVRDVDDLTVSDFGILASTGQVRIDAAGALTFTSPVQASGLIAESDHSITSTVGAVMTLGVLGLDLTSNDTFDATATGAITLAAPITIDELDAAGVRDTTLVQNKLAAASTITLSNRFYSPLAGTTTFSGATGVTIGGPVQVGSTQLNADSTAFTVFDHDFNCVSVAGGIRLLDVPGGDAIVRSLQATNIISFDARETIEIAGTIFAGTLNGNPLDLVETDALPAINIVGDADVVVTTTGGMQTSSLENKVDANANGLIGRISVEAGTQFDMNGFMDADGPIRVVSGGDIYLYGPTTARSTIAVTTTQGSIDVQGRVRAIGGTYTTGVPAALLPTRNADISLSAPLGGVSTSGLGSLTTGGSVLVSPDSTAVTYGVVRIDAQQDILLDAEVDSDGDVFATSKLGLVSLGALVQANNPEGDATVTIEAANGITQDEFGRLVGKVSVRNTGLLTPATPSDIGLGNLANRISEFTARNESVNGKTRVYNSARTARLGPVEAAGDFEYVNEGTITVSDVVHTNGRATVGNGNITLRSTAGGINVSSSVLADVGTVSISANGEVIQRGGSLADVFLLSGGRRYEYAVVTAEPPPGAGDVALVQAIITPYPSPPFNGVVGFISALKILDPGWGYFSGQRIELTITGDGQGAKAVGVASIVSSSIEGAAGVTVTANERVALVNQVRSELGNVSLKSERGDVSAQSITALGGAAEVSAVRGKIIVETAAAKSAIDMNAGAGVEIRNSANTTAGDLSITTLNGPLDFRGTATVLGAQGGSITLESVNGTILTPPVLNATDGVEIRAFGTLTLNNAITTNTGDVVAESTSGGIILNSYIKALASSIDLQAKNDFTAQSVGGVTSVLIVDGGSGYSDSTFVAFAPPASPPLGVTPYPAYGRPVIANGEITQIIIVSPGQGYEDGEQVQITITDPDATPGTGAIAVGFCSRPQQSLYALEDISVDVVGSILLAGRVQAVNGSVDVNAQEGVVVQSSVNSTDGDISFRTVNRDLDFSSPSALVGATNGSVTLVSVNGRIINPPVLQVTGGVTISSFQDLTIVNPMTANAGDISLESTGGNVAIGVGAAAVPSNVLADRRVTLSARTGITQPNGFIRGTELVVSNRTNTAVTLANPLNNVDNVAIANLGGVTYVDADDFETGVNRVAPLAVEIRGDAVSLSSVAPYSVVRVVSGLSYRTLSIAAGTSSGATVGTVEFVTTSQSDNTNAGPFGGTLRDMMKYSRSNTAVYTIGGSTKPQPMALVFDEAGYPVQEITINSNLPLLSLPVNVLGGRLEATVVAAGVERVGILGSASVNRGLTYGRGSEGSLVSSTALYGFSGGASMLVASGRNTFENLYVGMSDAEVAVPNMIGLLLTGPASVGNLVGGEVEADVDADSGVGNIFVANRAAGIFIDSGASGNRVAGNVIGDVTGVRPAFANGDGVRIRGSSANVIGVPGTAAAPVLYSNVISGNANSGVLVLNANSGSVTRANRIQNNLIERSGGVTRPNTGAGAGVLVHGSTFVDIGGSTVSAGNTIISQGTGGTAAVDGVRIFGSANVRVVANDVGVAVDPITGDESINGNTGHGISVARSTAVQVSGRNIIGGNLGDGVAISDASTGVSVTGNLIGLFSNGGEGGNLGDGVSIRAAIGNTVGAGNRIAFNRDGVSINDAVAATLAAGNTVTGSEVFRNLAAGVRVVGGSRSSIGGLAAATGNVIGENDGDGVRIEWSTVTGAPTGHVVQGNAIGTDNDGGFVNRGNVGSGIVVSGGTANVVSNGNRVMNNLRSGVDLVGGSANVLGGAGVGGNTVENNLDDGVSVSAFGATGWVRFVRVTSGGANYSADTFVTLGAPTAAGGITARAVPVIRTVRGVPGVIVGFFVDEPGLGYTPNAAVSVVITDPAGTGSGAAAAATATLASTTVTAARDHVVHGNAIRLNGANGVAAVGAGVSGLTVGQKVTTSGVTGVGNVIEDNIGYGVAVAAEVQRVGAQGNSIFGNLLGGISIGSGANRSTASTFNLTAAEIRQPAGGGEQIVVRGTLANPLFPSQQYSVDLYASQPDDGNYPALSGYQARRFLGRATVTAGANGIATLAITISASIEVGEVITATATALRFEAGSTSVISNAVTADYPGIPTPRF